MCPKSPKYAGRAPAYQLTLKSYRRQMVLSLVACCEYQEWFTLQEASKDERLTVTAFSQFSVISFELKAQLSFLLTYHSESMQQ